MSEIKHEHVHKSKIEIFFNNFLGGIAWGLGATFGISVVLALIGYTVSKINMVPVVGNFVTQVYLFILQNNPNLINK